MGEEEEIQVNQPSDLLIRAEAALKLEQKLVSDVVPQESMGMGLDYLHGRFKHTSNQPTDRQVFQSHGFIGVELRRPSTMEYLLQGTELQETRPQKRSRVCMLRRWVVGWRLHRYDDPIRILGLSMAGVGPS